MEAAFEAEPAAYRDGLKTFKAKKTIYGDASVKNALKRMQVGKCAFCESKIDHVAHGDVEHFRPKAGVSEGHSLTRPGYYWLAYEWSNLFFACQLCNQAFKKNLFPLEDPSRRARSHRDELAAEAPLLIDPAREDPEEHLAFASWTPVPRDESPKGKATIESLGLDRVELEERRRERFKDLDILRDILDQPGLAAEFGARARSVLEQKAGDNAEYAAMARAFLASRPLPSV